MLVENLNKDYISTFWQDRLTSNNTVTVRVPGSTANLGPGFDTIGLALDIYLELTLALLPKNDKRIPLLTACDANQNLIGTGANNFVSNVLKKHLNLGTPILERLRVFIQSNIPLERGLGSSAAVITGLLCASNKLNNQKFTVAQLLSRAAIIEGHADNVAASLLGGLTIVANSIDTQETISKKLPWPDSWETILVIPARRSQTSEARRVLPQNIPHKDAVYNLQRAALLLTAVNQENEELMREALHDRLHEQYRSPLVPELNELKKLLHGGPSIGCVLSGAGSSVLILVDRQNKKEVMKQIEKWRYGHNAGCDVLSLKVDQIGLEVLSSRRY